MSMRRPLIAPPVSATRYSPLNEPASTRTRVPRGKTDGSAAIKPRLTGFPLAVRPRRLYAVATYDCAGAAMTGAASTGLAADVGSVTAFSLSGSPRRTRDSVGASAGEATPLVSGFPGSVAGTPPGCWLGLWAG